MEIKQVGKSEGSRFDKISMQQLNGVFYDYLLTDPLGKQWHITVFVSKDASRAVVWAPVSDGTSPIYEQLKRKSVVFNKTRTGKEFYHIISITYIEDGRVKRKMIEDIELLPNSLRQFRIARHSEVTDKSKFANKLVVLVDKEDTASMAKIFYYEKLEPVIG
ncbi:MAG: hypothetical protein ARM1_0522 [Candidatus Micrarchaeota archaeon]|nr:MAG: hypothetical protein ARM1_0522 [Candidatus Micrarchaeota archaeon]